MSAKLVIFTDVDATLLDHKTYSFQAAKPALKRLKKLGIPVILTTSKTGTETEVISKKLRLNHPFIVENGGAVFIPEEYFPPSYFKTLGLHPIKKNGYQIIQLGLPYKMLRKVFKLIKEKTPARLVGFGDLEAEQIAILTGLEKREAVLASRREFDEPFLVEDSLAIQMVEAKKIKPVKATARIASLDQGQKSQALFRRGERLIKEEKWKPAKNLREIIKRLQKEAKKFGLKITEGGRFYHLTGDNDKGKAVCLLLKLYRLRFGSVVSLGLGDSANDWPMLKAVNYPVLVARPDGSYLELTRRQKNIYQTREPGPRGWAEALEYFLSRPKILDTRAGVSAEKISQENAGRKRRKK
ncbi:MAG: HAD-IIB family hydrolase [Candidatus Saccharicenans sp.]